ncbi:MAG: hypothetical protein JKY52_11450 [Flavobacteriales bacterium]|nr:hypothetical protein [Flavobacteriales bacterium]
MSYKIYITRDCPACERVETFIVNQSVDCEIIMIDDPCHTNLIELPIIYPALFQGKKLLAYGDDIIVSLVKRGYSLK